MTVLKTNPERGSIEKASLFCPECSRSAPVEEGWALEDHDGRTEISCPNCGTVVVSQPYFDAEHRAPPIAAD
jgi:endogenous inhibitor of DNA gyrase (YacG/DUF329 family)